MDIVSPFFICIFKLFYLPAGSPQCLSNKRLIIYVHIRRRRLSIEDKPKNLLYKTFAYTVKGIINTTNAIRVRLFAQVRKGFLIYNREIIYVLHECGAPRHYSALRHLISNKYIGSACIKYREFTIIRPLLLSLIRRDRVGFIKQLKNVLSLTYLCISKRRVIVLGIAPYDYRLLLLRIILRNHIVLYHTSWPHWDFTTFPKNFLSTTRIIKKTWQRFLEKQVRGIFCATQAVYLALEKSYSIPADKTIVYHSYNKNSFFPRKTLTPMKKMGIVFVGRLTHEKGIPQIIEIINTLPQDLFFYTFVGDGPLRACVQDLAFKKKYVNYAGYMEVDNKVGNILRHHDILLLPSMKGQFWEETVGIVVIEAMACGVIPICSNHAGPKELIDHCVNGFLFSEDDYVRKSLAIILELAVQRHTLVQMKQKAILMSARFTEDTVAEKWDSIIANHLRPSAEMNNNSISR